VTPIDILDTGPLVAFLDRSDSFHDWSDEQFRSKSPIFITCEAVVSEAGFLLRKVSGGFNSLLTFLREAPIIIHPIYDGNKNNILDLLDRYSDVPMSFADACLVRLSELYPDAPILTLDSDFLIYRRNKNERLPVLLPEDRM